MPRKTVVEMACDRCKRTWYPEVKKDAPEPTTPSAALIFRDEKGETVLEELYEVLCESCAGTVRNYLANISKELKGKSPHRMRKQRGNGEVAKATSPSGPITDPQQRVRR